MRYQTAPRPEGDRRRLRGAAYVGSSYAEAGDGNRTRSSSLEGSRATVNTSPALVAIIGSGSRGPAGLRRSVCETQRPRDGSKAGSPAATSTMSLSRSSPTHARAWATLAAALVLLAIAGATLLARDAQGAPSQKNVVFILTDDMTYSELSAMPNVQSLLAAQGTSFNEAYISFPLCCPSRATMMSGQYMHNHGVRGNFPPNGGWPKFRSHESNALPVWLQNDGYYNVHIGKYLNCYGTVQDNTLPVPQGWDEWYGKVSEDALYYNYQLI